MVFPEKIEAKKGKSIDLITFEKPTTDCIVLESVTSQNIKIIHVVDMSHRDSIKVGRGHESEVRITDISVSRGHASIHKTRLGEFYVEDNNSKFGTLVLIRKPYMLDNNGTTYIQAGRTVLEVVVKEPLNYCASLCECFINRNKRVAKGSLAFDGEDFFPEEFL